MCGNIHFIFHSVECKRWKTLRYVRNAPVNWIYTETWWLFNEREPESVWLALIWKRFNVNARNYFGGPVNRYKRTNKRWERHKKTHSAKIVRSIEIHWLHPNFNQTNGHINKIKWEREKKHRLQQQSKQEITKNHSLITCVSLFFLALHFWCVRIRQKPFVWGSL